MVLTTKQKDELHRAMLDYLRGAGFAATAEQLKQEAGVDYDDGVSGLLEKKWTSVVRLQKKIMDLEAKVEQLTEDLKSAGPGKPGAKLASEKLPRTPAARSLTGHRGTITQVAFHPTYGFLASGCEDASVRVWDSDTGALERTLKGHTGAVNGVAFDHTGILMATCSADLSVKLWDMETFACTKTLNGHEHSVSAVAFLPSGELLASASRDKTLRIWEVSTGYCLRTLKGHEEWVRGVSVLPEGGLTGVSPLLASCSSDQSLRVWNWQTGQCTGVLQGHDHVVECVAFPPTQAAAVQAAALFAAALQPANGASVAGTSIGAVSTASGGGILASGSRDKTARIWDIATGQCRQVLRGHDNWVRSVVVHPSGKYLLTSSDDKSVRVWDLSSGKALRTLQEAHSHFVSCLAINCRSNPAIMATGGVDQTVKLWECK
eukprot:tig00000480_g1297.t1